MAKIFRVLPCIALCIAAALFLARPAQAAFKSVKDAVSPREASNPNPLDDDIILPMPCGLSLAMRVVAVPASSLMRDRAFAMGVNNSADSERNLYERQFEGHIAAPFGVEDLPASWRPRVQGSNLEGDSFYFIGKYELSRLQYASVMEAVNADGEENPALCPKDVKGASLPATGNSWFDVQDFLRKYNAWLVRAHPDAIPRFAGTPNIGFLRLPTEEEWEYAARGGARVPQEWWSDKDMFPLEKDAKLQDYGVYNYGQALEGPAPIGSRKPNPLGLYDTVGNAREMLDSFFRLSVAHLKGETVERRLHGGAGGILTKGGSYLSGENTVIPGWRDEVPLFTINGPGAPSDLGVRLVLSGLNIPDGQRLRELRRAEKHLYEEAPQPFVLKDQKSPTQALDALIERSEGTLKENLRQVQALLNDQQTAENNRRLDSVEHSLRSMLYQAETLRAFAFRYSAAKKQQAGIKELLAKPMDEANRARVEKLLKEANSDLEDYLESLQMGANYYKRSLGVVLAASDADLAGMLAQARREYGGNGIFNEHISQNINVLEKYLKQARAQGLSSITSKMILKSIIPEQHLKNLPL